MKSNKFRNSLLIFTAVCAALGAAFLIYVYIVVSNYDKVQPERVVQGEIDRLKAAAASGDMSSAIDFGELFDSRYETADTAKLSADYAKKLEGEITFSQAATESGELKKMYTLYSDGENIGRFTLEGSDPRNELFFFSTADWKVTSFEPRVADVVYNLKLFCPEGIELRVNGVTPEESGEFTLTGTPVYSINGLLNEPEIAYRKADGTEIPYTVESNTVKPLVYSYTFELPAGIKVTADGESVSGTPRGGGFYYSVGSMTKPDIRLTDALGNSLSYSGEGSVPLHRYTAYIPGDCALSFGDRNADSFCEAAAMDNPDAAALLKLTGITLPALKKYELSFLSDSVTATVSSGENSREFTLESGDILELFSFGSQDGIPDDIAAEVDVIDVAKKWSLFMTDDLEGDYHGFATITDYLIYGSDYYKHAMEWATGIDILQLSTHTMDGFGKERMSDFVRYGDSCFSCNIFFEKYMTLYYEERLVGYRTDTFSSIIYFVKAEDGSWRIALMHDVDMGEGDGDEQA